MGLSRPAVSRQLALLVEGGLVRRRPSPIDGRNRDYLIDPSMHDPIIAWLAGVDLRKVRPTFQPHWSPPARVHRLRHAVRVVEFEREPPPGRDDVD